MKIKVAEAKGKPLDWAVGMALDPGHAKTLWRLMKNGKWNPSTDWGLAGPIIEREGIEFRSKGRQASYAGGRTWFGENHLTAGMRCYVASQLGNEIDVPEELI